MFKEFQNIFLLLKNYFSRSKIKILTKTGKFPNFVHGARILGTLPYTISRVEVQ